MLGTWGTIGLSIVALAAMVVCYFYFAIWLQALVSGAYISMARLVAMSLRRVNPREIVHCRVMAAQAGLPPLPASTIEAQLLAGGNPNRVTQALIAANRARISLDWDTAAAIDLAGRDILNAVQVSVSPIVINCPDPNAVGSDELTGVAQDGIEVSVRARVTVRMDLLRLIGGATETTVVARVGQGVVSAIGSCATYQEVMAEPMLICRRVFEKGLDAQTAFAIVSIDIAEMKVGRNVGARLKIESAQADIRIARAEAEKRRSMAIARTQEMVAHTAENQARVVQAEAKVPLGLAHAFRSGQLEVPNPTQPDVNRRSRRQFAWQPPFSSAGTQRN